MKAEIHPNYKTVQVVCSCGNHFTTRSTIKNETIRVEVCNECHPFYTGKHKIVDTEGRVDQFMKKFGSTAAAASNDQK
jgi:large subunit ribosomal protein L31